MIEQFTSAQLATVLSALDGQPRNPNSKKSAMSAIDKAGRIYNLTAEEILQASAPILDGSMSDKEFRHMLKNEYVPESMREAVSAEAETGPDAAEVADQVPEAEEPAEGDVGATVPADKPVKERKPKTDSKQEAVIAMLKHEQGATVHQIRQITDWLPHTVRGFISGTIRKKLGYEVATTKTKDANDKSVTIYHIVGKS